MIAFLKCVGEAFVEQGLRGLASMVPGGPYALKVAESALQKYRKNRNDQAIRDDIQQLAQQSFDEAKRAAEEVAREVAGQAPIEDRIKLELVLAQIPANVRQTLKRADDPSGKTVPAAFQLRSADDVVNLIPARAPRFVPGTPLPERRGWVLTRQLGLGGFGEVWLAVNQLADHLQYAVKFGRDADADRDLVNERDVIIRLMKANPHPSLVPLKDVSFDGDIPWLAYEYVSGGDLADLIRVLQALPQDQRLIRATAAFRELVEAVAELHKQNIVHRDLKPSNILIEANTQRLRVTDFGISGLSAKKDLRDELAGTTTRAGRMMSALRGSHTALYASPQQKDPNNNPDPRDDVHALGVIGYQLFTGHLTQGAGPDMAEDLKDAGVNADLVEVIKQCVSQKQERRPDNAGALLARLPASEPDAVPLTMAAARKASSASTPPAARVIVAEQVPPSVLPPLPKEILELEGKVASLELTISEIEKGTHPNLRDAADSLRARGVSVEAVIQRLKHEIDKNPNHSATELCRLFPDAPTTALMPVIACLLRRVELAKELTAQARRLTDLQTEDFHQLLEKTLAPAPDKAFPLLVWNRITEHVEIRRYRFATSGIELLKHAEEFYHGRQVEEELWSKAKAGSDIAATQRYMTRFPNGRYLKSATDQIGESQRRQQAAQAAEQRRQQVERESAARAQEEAARRQEEQIRREADLQRRAEKRQQRARFAGKSVAALLGLAILGAVGYGIYLLVVLVIGWTEPRVRPQVATKPGMARLIAQRPEGGNTSRLAVTINGELQGSLPPASGGKSSRAEYEFKPNSNGKNTVKFELILRDLFGFDRDMGSKTDRFHLLPGTEATVITNISGGVLTPGDYGISLTWD